MSRLRPDVVIPARYNETTILPVVMTFLESDQTGNIIVSLDLDAPLAVIEALKPVIKDPGVIVKASWTRGKGQVVRAGLRDVTSDRVIFADADVTGLTIRHADILAEQDDYPDLIIGIPDLPTTAELAALPSGFTRAGVIRSWSLMSGFRSVWTGFARDIRLHGYLMETQINQAARRAGFTVDYRTLRGLRAPLNLTEQRLDEMMRDRKWGISAGILPR